MMSKTENSEPGRSYLSDRPMAVHINVTFEPPHDRPRPRGVPKVVYQEPGTDNLEVRRRHREAFEKRIMPIIRPYLNRPVAWDELGDPGVLIALASTAYTLAVATGQMEYRERTSEIMSRIVAATDHDRDPYWLTDESFEDNQEIGNILDWFAPSGWFFGFLENNPELGFWPIPRTTKSGDGRLGTASRR